jgi:hypothetical protein
MTPLANELQSSTSIACSQATTADGGDRDFALQALAVQHVGM